jgi:hypothetical protein
MQWEHALTYLLESSWRCRRIASELTGEGFEAIDGELAEDVVEVSWGFGAADQGKQGVGAGSGGTGIGDVGEEVGELAAELVAEQLDVFQLDRTVATMEQLLRKVIGETKLA